VTLPVLLFTHDPAYGHAASCAGIGGIVVDWEFCGKDARQAGAGTEINDGTVDDLIALRAACDCPVICRVNNAADTRIAEAQLAVELGADEVWLPMVRSLDEVEECLDALGPTTPLGVLVETNEAIELGPQLARLPLARVYIGLNDLRIDRGRTDMFEPLWDGTIDRFRATFDGQFGVAGVTDPDRGAPIPQRDLLAVMARLRCDFGVARRSFRADVRASEIAFTLERISRVFDELLSAAMPSTTPGAAT
jgi:hypothetical protein